MEGNDRIIFNTTSEVCKPGTSDSSVWLGAGRQGDLGPIPGRGERIFPVASVSRLALGPPASCTMGTRGTIPEAKSRQGPNADHLLPSGVEVENE
jgi:hypothetical protein